MKSEIKLENTVLANLDGRREVSRLRQVILSPLVCTVFASFGIFGGISSLFAGLICVMIHGVIPQDKVFDAAGTALLIVAIPMILVGSIFLDEIPVKK